MRLTNNARAGALQRGEMFYPGNPCFRGHSGKRYANSGVCAECRHSVPSPALREYYRTYAEESRKANRAFLRSEKAKPCADCATTFPWFVMEFDHRDGRGDGDNTVANLVGYSMSRLKVEMAKCDVLCANCHRIRTHLRAAASGLVLL